MSDHHQNVCQYGTVHGQRRCPSPNKSTRRVECPTPQKCAKKTQTSSGIVTFDLDSTLADTEHRFHLIDRENGTDWHRYSQACVDDTPVAGLVTMVRLLHEAGVEVHALSGRKSTALEQTKQWFEKHEIPIEHIWLDESDQGDYITKNHHVEYKLARLREVERKTGKKVILHVDDWAGVAHAFEQAGIPCVCVRTPFEIRELVGADSRDVK